MPGENFVADDMKDTRIIAVYQELCKSYLAIQDSRLKLLGTVIIASGIGISASLNPALSSSRIAVLLPVGLVGVLGTLAVLSYDLHQFLLAIKFVVRGREIEGQLEVEGPFKYRPASSSRPL